MVNSDLLTVVSDRIARALNNSGATRAVPLDISKAFDRVGHAGLLHELKGYLRYKTIPCHKAALDA